MKNTFLLSIIFSLVMMACGGRPSIIEEKLTAYQQELVDEGWLMSSPAEGDMPTDYGIQPATGILDNYFDIDLGGDLDMAIKIVDIEDGNVIRYVYVPAGSDVTVNEIPAGKYYLKISYGKDWMEKVNGGIKMGKFTRETHYEQSTSIFDFGAKNSLEAISVSLKIHIAQDPRYENFATTSISEQQFFTD